MKLALAISAVLSLAGGCEPRREDAVPAGPPPTPAIASATPVASLAPSAAAPPGSASARVAVASSGAVAVTASAPAGDGPLRAAGGWELGSTLDAGPSAPAVASAAGVAAVTSAGAVVLLAVPTERARPRGPPPRFPVDLAFARGRAPAIAGRHLYRVVGGRLVRSPLAGGAQEVLAEGARDGTRVAADELADGPIVAWIAAGDDDRLRAKLWRGGAAVDASPDGAGASSVALARTASGLLLLALDVRTGMTQLHAARIVSEGGRVRTEGDVVAWVGGSGGSYTEVSAASDGRDATAWVAMGRGVAGFGLATIEVGGAPRVDAPTRWLDYPNGLDPAPAAGVAACGRLLVAFVRPMTAAPGADRALLVADARGDEPIEVARARDFGDVSVAPAEGGALVVWFSSERTWARRLRCPPPR